jgi:predicted metal-dependent enzyme (double-stranded beta helix superfamily)
VFDLDRFAEDCRAALVQDRGGQRALREVVARAVADPGAIVAALGEPRRGAVTKLHHAPDLTVLNVVWGPRMTIHPHDHRMAAVIGVYAGAEDNIFWRRAEGGGLEAAGARALRARDCAVLGKDIIHSVTNPLARLTGAIHVYAGDFFAAERSEWDPETLAEHPYDVGHTMRLFEESNAALAAAR